MLQDWFSKGKLGIFIHYGIYAVGSVSESWSFHNGNISYEDYMKQLDGFTASKYDPEKWADLFKKAGASYVVLTAKHHDGVALFDTKYSNHNVVKSTPAKRDLIEGYADAVRSRGMKVGIYYSLIDWSREDYRSVYSEGTRPEDYAKDNVFASPAGGPEKPELWEQFLQFNNNQITELMTNYGTIDLLWFDGDWERSAKQWKMPEFKDLLLSLNPNVVCNSRLQGYGDYKTPEQGIPTRSPGGAWEFCTTINMSWGYDKKDNQYKTSRQVVRMFCDCITMGGNMLLDVGPMEDGTIDPRQEQVLLDLGAWISDNSEAIYNTVQGLEYNFYLGGSTLSGDKKTLYLFVYDIPKVDICLKGLCNVPKKISILHSGQELAATRTGAASWSSIPGVLWINMEKADLHPMVTVVKLELEEPLKLYYGEGQVISQN